MESVFSKSLVQVDEVLKYLDENDKAKIPNSTYELIQKNKSKKYTWEIDKSKKLVEQDLDIYAAAFLSYINYKYLANKEQKRFLEQLFSYNDKYKNGGIASDKRI